MLIKYYKPVTKGFLTKIENLPLFAFILFFSSTYFLKFSS